MRDASTGPAEDALRVAIVDDEPLARRTIRRIVERDPRVEVVGEAFGTRAVEMLRETRPDLVFLDIQMPGLNGFEVLEALESDRLPLVVFVTAYDEHALQAFEVRALDYLVKPYTDDRLDEALRRAKSVLASRDLEEARKRLLSLLASRSRPEAVPAHGSVQAALNRLALRDGSRTVLVRLDEVEWIEASGPYVQVHALEGRPLLVRKSLTHLEESLPPDRFFRIHRSAIVNLDQVSEVVPLSHGDYTVRLRRGTELRLSRSRKEEFDARVES